MNIIASLTAPRRLCNTAMVASFIYMAGIWSKEHFPETLGSSRIWLWGGDIGAAFLLSFCLFFSICGLATESDGRKRKTHLFTMLFSLLTYSLVLAAFFYGYVLWAWALNLQGDLQGDLQVDVHFSPKTLAYISEPDVPEAKRLNLAKVVYDISGTRLTYRTDAGGWATFEPSQHDLAERKVYEDGDAKNAEMTSLVKGQMWQLRYLFGFHLGALCFTFAVAAFWLTFRKRPSP